MAAFIDDGGAGAVEKVFIYGTLKRGFANHHYVWGRIGYLGRCQTVEPYPLVIGGKWFSPFLLEEPGRGEIVVGDLFEADEDAMEMMDRLEGVGRPKGYLRDHITVEMLDDRARHNVWAYLKDRDCIQGDLSDPIAEYLEDDRYVPPAERPPG